MEKNDFTPEGLLDKKQDTPTVCFTRFVLQTNVDGGNRLYCFVEGYDMPYYISRVENIGNIESYPIICDNKKNVINLYYDLKRREEYQKYKTAFFVDRDFDDNSDLLYEKIYVTPCYAIENLFVGTDCISKILKCEYNLIPGDGPEYDRAMALYEQELKNFHNSVLLFNSWYACLKGKLAEGEKSVCLEDTLPTGFVTLEMKNVRQQYDLSKIMQKFQPLHVITQEEIDIKSKELSNDCVNNLRGKYELQFLTVYLEFLNIDSKGGHYYTKKKSGININKKKFISQFSQYGRTPDCLRNYIIERCKN
ncbi:hypothetical protein EZS27_004376 [termite gut metagenome]|uniref:DUF4435 domain-containing protein n=1 Tax=termite gut metagenome TaxID=433724 RepID=A0A5J4SSE1_9ZZZZ